MLAWGGLLSDEQIGQVVNVLKRSGVPPQAVEAGPGIRGKETTRLKVGSLLVDKVSAGIWQRYIHTPRKRVERAPYDDQ
jgi:hypothetical protein